MFGKRGELVGWIRRSKRLKELCTQLVFSQSTTPGRDFTNPTSVKHAKRFSKFRDVRPFLKRLPLRVSHQLKPLHLSSPNPEETVVFISYHYHSERIIRYLLNIAQFRYVSLCNQIVSHPAATA